MIQRFQSVFLLIAAMALAVFLGTTSYTNVISPTESVSVNAFYFLHQVGDINSGNPIFYIGALATISILVSIFAIFLYKNRIRQIAFVAVNSLLMMVVLGAVVFQIIKTARPMAPNGDETFGVGFFALIVAMLANLLANRFIKRDEKRVREADRIR